MAEQSDELYAGVEVGESVYDEDGEELGTVRGLDDEGFYVLAPDSAPRASISDARELTGRDYVMWRCWECGAMDQIEAALPAACPECGADREELYYWAED